MPKYWMITNRSVTDSGLGDQRTEQLSFYTADSGPIDHLGTWTRRSASEFNQALAAQADQFPLVPNAQH